MLSDTPKLETTSKKIEFPASQEDTEFLLAAMRQPNTTKAKSWPTAERLLKICRQFDFALVGSSIASQLDPLAGCPLRMFSVASQYNNIALARTALASWDRVWSNNPHFSADLSLALSGGCSVPYLLGLLECIDLCPRKDNVITQEAWKSKVSAFMPKVRTTCCCRLLAVLTANASLGRLGKVIICSKGQAICLLRLPDIAHDIRCYASIMENAHTLQPARMIPHYLRQPLLLSFPQTGLLLTIIPL